MFTIHSAWQWKIFPWPSSQQQRTRPSSTHSLRLRSPGPARARAPSRTASTRGPAAWPSLHAQLYQPRSPRPGLGREWPSHPWLSISIERLSINFARDKTSGYRPCSPNPRAVSLTPSFSLGHKSDIDGGLGGRRRR